MYEEFNNKVLVHFRHTIEGGPGDKFSHAFCFSFSFPIVQLEKIRIGHDGRGLGTGWYVEEVVIIIHDECWIFPCNRWLADYEDDGKTERDLYAGEREMVGAQIVLERGKTSLLELCRLNLN